MYKSRRWQDEAVCLTVQNKEIFFPVSKDDPKFQDAVSYCRICPVSSQCLRYALETNTTSGVWGGKFLSSTITEGETKPDFRTWYDTALTRGELRA